MSRSSKKGPYVDEKLLIKISKLKEAGKKEPIKTWSRSSQISPEFVGYTFLVHNGKIFNEVFVSETRGMERLVKAYPTRNFRGHGRMVKRLLTKT